MFSHADPDPRVVVEKIADDHEDVATASLLEETGHGVGKRERFVGAVLDAVSIEPYDLEVAEAHAALSAHVRRIGTPRGAHDLIIAATARAQDREVVSLDRSGFAELPGVSLAGGFG